MSWLDRFDHWALTLAIFVPAAGALVCMLWPRKNETGVKVVALLSSLVALGLGVYIFARAILSAGDIPDVVGAVGAIAATITLVYAFAMYLPQQDLKLLLVYSTIAQLAYIFLALSLSTFGSYLAFTAGIAHIFNHAFAKSLFFLVSGSLSFTTGTRRLPLLQGILARMPLVGISFGVAAMAIAGVPPMNLFFSKFALFAGGFQVSHAHLLLLPLVLIAILESVGTFGWFLMRFGRAVPGEPSATIAGATPLPRSMALVLIALVAVTLCSGMAAPAWLG